MTVRRMGVQTRPIIWAETSASGGIVLPGVKVGDSVRVEVPGPAESPVLVMGSATAVIVGRIQRIRVPLTCGGSIVGVVTPPPGLRSHLAPWDKVLAFRVTPRRGVSTHFTAAAFRRAGGYFCFPALRTGTYEIRLHRLPLHEGPIPVRCEPSRAVVSRGVVTLLNLSLFAE